MSIIHLLGCKFVPIKLKSQTQELVTQELPSTPYVFQFVSRLVLIFTSLYKFPQTEVFFKLWTYIRCKEVNLTKFLICVYVCFNFHYDNVLCICFS